MTFNFSTFATKVNCQDLIPVNCSHHDSKSAGWDAAQYVYGGVADLSWLRFPEAALATNLGDYNALDPFGGISNVQWKQGDEQRETLQHFYDAAGNRLARLNLLSKDAGRHELYHYDSLSRLESFQQGNGLNLYQYVAGSPTNFVDPTGEFPWLAVGAIAIGAALFLAPSPIDPQSQVGVSDEAAAAFYKENWERQIDEVAFVLSLPVSYVGGARTLIGRMTLAGGTNVGLQGAEDLITYSMTGQHDYVDAQGNFSASAMATSYFTNFVVGAAFPGAATVLGRGARWTGQRVARSGQYLSGVGHGLHIYGPGNVHLGMSGGGAADVIDRLVFAHRFARGRIVLRALNEGDVVSIAAGRGIRRGAGRTAPVQHIRGVANHPNNPWISATRSAKSAVFFATHTPEGAIKSVASPVAAIDLYKLRSAVSDFSTRTLSRRLPHKRVADTAFGHQEVLIYRFVNQNAIVRFVKVSG